MTADDLKIPPLSENSYPHDLLRKAMQNVLVARPGLAWSEPSPRLPFTSLHTGLPLMFGAWISLPHITSMQIAYLEG